MGTYYVVRHIEDKSVVHAGPFKCPIAAQTILSNFYRDYQEFVIDSGSNFIVYRAGEVSVRVRIHRLT